MRTRSQFRVRRAGSIVPRCSARDPQKKKQTTSDAFDEILRIRAARKKGISVSIGAIATAVAVAVGSGAVAAPLLPPLEAVVPAAASLVVASAVAKLLLGERLHVEFDGARPFAEILPPFDDDGSSDDGDDDGEKQTPRRSRRPDGRPWLVVRDVRDGRGKGVYVSDSRGEGGGSGSRRRSFLGRPLPRGAFLGCYEGDLLDERAFWARYPRGVGDYCIGCGGGWCLDGAPVAERLRKEEEGQLSYSPCLINHSSSRHNVTRITRRNQKRVELYASRDILQGEEVLLDYGRRYWLGREGEEKE